MNKLKKILLLCLPVLIVGFLLYTVANASIGGGGISGIPYFVPHDFSPSVDSSFDLGSDTLRWKKIWADDGDFTSITISGATDGALVIDVDDDEALVVRKDGDGGDIFIVDTNTPAVTVATSSVFTYVYERGFTLASSTWMSVGGTGTSTAYISPAMFPQTLETLACEADQGTFDSTFSDGTNLMDFIHATSTPHDISLTTNNSFTFLEPRRWVIGNFTGDPNWITCGVTGIAESQIYN